MPYNNTNLFINDHLMLQKSLLLSRSLARSRDDSHKNSGALRNFLASSFTRSTISLSRCLSLHAPPARTNASRRAHLPLGRLRYQRFTMTVEQVYSSHEYIPDGGKAATSTLGDLDIRPVSLRWLQLVIFALSSMTNNIIWITASPISHEVVNIYKLPGIGWVNCTSLAREREVLSMAGCSDTLLTAIDP